MKRKVTQNYSGITICDSIVVSVKKKRRDLRKLESVAIAVIGFVSVIMSFLGMFEFDFKVIPVIYTAVICSAAYITISLIGRKALLFYLGSILIFAAAASRYFSAIKDGFKFVYNVIYSDSYHTEINYYKLLKAENEEHSTTVFFVFCIWLLALVIYFFTIYKPNPVINVLITFPIIEVGLYNGIALPVFWGILTVAYWLALLSISTIDLGEYSGGSGGFVRKGNLFYPKRQMRLKVTEKCAMLIITSMAAVTVVTIAVMQLTGYERSEKINQRRAAIKEAVTSFTFDDFASSVSALTESFGFTFEYESHKLGTSSRLTYKNVTDLVVTVDKKYDGAIYLKNYSGSVYEDNEWFDLSKATLKKAESMFSDFETYSAYPQDFPHIYMTKAFPELSDLTIWIDPQRKKNKAYAPYGTNNYGDITYKYDTVLASKKENSSEYSYKFIGINAESAAEMLDKSTRNVYSTEYIIDSSWQSTIDNYCSENNLFSYDSYFPIDSEIKESLISQNDLYDDGSVLMTSILENQYRTFVYENYLQIPDNVHMDEVRELFSDILENGVPADTASDKLALLNEIRERINDMTEYSLSPGKTPSNRDFVNYFLLENHKGYCTHYATAGVLLARMAGIPARYSTGYVIVGDDFNDGNKQKDGSYSIELKDNRSHAWAEIYFDGFGWVPFEFTAGYSDMSINTNTTTSAITTTNQTTTTTSAPKTSQTSRNTTRRQTTSANITTTVVTTTSVTTQKDIGTGFGSGSLQLSEAQKNTILILGTIIAIAVLMIFRRHILLILRRRKFENSDKRKSIAAIYCYVERLLKFLDIEREQMPYSDFADYVETKLNKIYFSENDFRILMQLALQGSFGKDSPPSSEIKFAKAFAENFSRAIYSESNALRKFYLKYILGLI